MVTVTLAALGQATPADLVATVRAASDAELAGLAVDVAAESALVSAVLGRLDTLAVPARLAATAGRVRWQTPRGAGATVALRDGGSTLTDESPDVLVEGTPAQLLRLVAGQLDLAAAYLGDQIRFRGDSALVLALAGLFAADGTAPVTGTPVDVRDVDPVAIAAALHGVPVEHLRTVLASDFRPLVLDEILGRMPSFLNGRKAAGVQVTAGFRLTGRPDGEVDRFVLRLRDGRATVLVGEAADAVAPEDCQATVTCEAADFLRLATGHLSPVSGVLRGQLRVTGDKIAALRLGAAFDVPTAVAG